jgi:hypothetical protein
VQFSQTLPETFIDVLQVGTFSLLLPTSLHLFRASVSLRLRRIEKYVNITKVIAVPPLDQQSKTVAFRVQSCTFMWPQYRNTSSQAPSAASTPKHKFVLVDLSLNFPQGELSLICGQRSPPDSLASFSSRRICKEDWLVSKLIYSCVFLSTLS